MPEPTRHGATPNEGDGKRVLLILGTPKDNSLCHALADAYTRGARSQGHVVHLLALGSLQFDPILRAGYDQSQALEPDLIEAQRQIHWAEHLVLVHPLWWEGPPALLKGFLERVLLPGFAFRARGPGRWEPLLHGRSADLLVTLDISRWQSRLLPWHWAHRRALRVTLRFCGIRPRRLREFTPVGSADEAQRQAWVSQAEQLGCRA